MLGRSGQPDLGGRQAGSRHRRPTADDIDVANIDTADGEKIVKNVFGDNEEQVVNQLGGLGGGSSLFKSLLPMLAPIVMGYLGKQAAGGGRWRRGAARRAQTLPLGGGGGGSSDIVGGLLGGGEGGGGLGDMLGGLLGGGGEAAEVSATCSAASSEVASADVSSSRRGDSVPAARRLRSAASTSAHRGDIDGSTCSFCEVGRRCCRHRPRRRCRQGRCCARRQGQPRRPARPRVGDADQLAAQPRHDLRRRRGLRRGGRSTHRRQVRDHAACGGEVVPGLEVLQNVQSGAYPIGHTASYYYIGLASWTAFGTALPFGLNSRQQNAWLYEGGGLTHAAGAVRPDVRGDPVPGRQHRLPDGRLVPRRDHVRRRPRRPDDAHRRVRRGGDGQARRRRAGDRRRRDLPGPADRGDRRCRVGRPVRRPQPRVRRGRPELLLPGLVGSRVRPSRCRSTRPSGMGCRSTTRT